MSKSTITVKYQTTVPKEVREKLKVGPSDVLQWEMAGDHVRVTASSRAFLDLRGSIKVGPGDPVEDVRRARERIGLDDV
jgi:bifunctional DNA-binding transcriptional regulator/antitoxin component of YhaV-PrlF toxin-antitoxin module